MLRRYVAKIYFDADEMMEESGDDIDELYNWMLIKTQGMFGNFKGEILDRQNGAVVRRFRKCPPD